MADPATPLVSVITITLNDRDGLARTIESLKVQECAPTMEHIVVDGLSGYDVSDLIAELEWTPRLYRGRDSGLYDAMNRGMDEACGEYLLFLNSGDTLAGSRVLSDIGSALAYEQPDFLWGDSFERQLDGGIEHKTSWPINRLPLGMITHHQAMLFRRVVLEEKMIRYDLRFSIAADYDFVLRHVRASRSLNYFAKPICIFERGGTSFEKRNKARREQFQIRRAVYGSTVFAASVFCAQWLLRSFRSLFPAGYWALRRRLG